MAYDTKIAERMRTAIPEMASASEMKMFGGIGFLVNGNMACGVHGDGIIVRVGEAGFEDALRQPHVRVFDMTGRPMKGWVVVDAAGCAEDAQLRRWMAAGIEYASALPPKPVGGKA